jgi:hypothetical protein
VPAKAGAYKRHLSSVSRRRLPGRLETLDQQEQRDHSQRQQRSALDICETDRSHIVLMSIVNPSADRPSNAGANLGLM